MNDYKTRLLSEYKELVDRISKLRVFLNKWDNGQLSDNFRLSQSPQGQSIQNNSKQCVLTRCVLKAEC